MSKQMGRGFRDLLQEAQQRDSYWTERAILEFTEELVRTMEDRNVSRAELARRIGSSQAYITKILGGNANFTLASMTKLARALGSEMRVHMAPAASTTRWMDRIEGGVDTKAPSAHSSILAPSERPESETVHPTESFRDLPVGRGNIRAAL